MTPQEVENYLQRKTKHLPFGESFLIIGKLMKIATEMWDGFALWYGDPVEARVILRQEPEVRGWLDAEDRREETEEQGESSGTINL